MVPDSNGAPFAAQPLTRNANATSPVTALVVTRLSVVLVVIAALTTPGAVRDTAQMRTRSRKKSVITAAKRGIEPRTLHALRNFGSKLVSLEMLAASSISVPAIVEKDDRTEIVLPASRYFNSVKALR